MHASLVTEYVHDVDGAYDVLRDALLERGLEPLPRADTLAERLDGVLARLPTTAQSRIASASVRRLVPDVVDGTLRAQVSLAIDTVAATAAPAALAAQRSGLFRALRSANVADRRVVWAAWMLLRGSPAIALRAARSVRAAELDAQILVVADAFTA